MKTFKQYLTESSKFMTAKQVLRACEQGNIRVGYRFDVFEDGSIKPKLGFHLNLYSSIFVNAATGELKVKFVERVERLAVDSIGLTSMRGFPRIVSTDMIAFSNRFRSLDGIPEEIKFGLDLSANPELTSFSGIHKRLKSCKTIVVSAAVEESVLGLLMVGNLNKAVPGDFDDKVHEIPRLTEALKIINEHLKGDRDVLACQEELIANGLKEFAKL